MKSPSYAARTLERQQKLKERVTEVPGHPTVFRAEGARSQSPTAKELLRAHPLPPGDPVGVLGGQPLTNIIETDANYALDQNDAIVICQTTLTVTLTSNPLTGTPVEIVADGGTVTVAGPIQGGNVTLAEGTIGFFAYSPLSGTYSALVTSSSSASYATMTSSGSSSVDLSSSGSSTLVSFFGLTGPVTVTLPTTPKLGQSIIVGSDDGSCTGTNTITLNAGAKTIATTGTATLTLTDGYAYVTVYWDGRIWALVSSYDPVIENPTIQGTVTYGPAKNQAVTFHAEGNATTTTTPAAITLFSIPLPDNTLITVDCEVSMFDEGSSDFYKQKLCLSASRHGGAPQAGGAAAITAATESNSADTPSVIPPNWAIALVVSGNFIACTTTMALRSGALSTTVNSAALINYRTVT